MTRRTWVRLDNASNMFLAARSEADPKVFRVSAQMDHDVDPQVLQEAVNATYDRYRLYHAVLKRAVFWYYLQDSDLRPLVTADEKHTCAPIYRPDRRNLLFRVMYRHERIILEIFHALSDGTGALWFLTDLVTEYSRLRSPENKFPLDTPAGTELMPGQTDSGAAAPDVVAEPMRELTTDSFTDYFHLQGRQTTHNDRTIDEPEKEGAHRSRDTSSGAGRLRGLIGKKVHRVKGTRTPDHRTRAVELTAPAKDVLALARAENVGLTMYLTAAFFESVRMSADDFDRHPTLAATVPVNLRQFFPSMSPRNFFATIRVEHTYGLGPDDLGSVCRKLENQFRPKATREALEKKLRTLMRFERMPALRIVPRPLKDVMLKLINWGSNRGLSVAVSNMGNVRLPAAIDSGVRRMLFHVSAVRPQLCAVSHAGLLTISFTSPFTQTGHIREFARLLTARGIEVTVAAARVTEAELAQVEDP